MDNLPSCEKCSCAYTYENAEFYVCPECGHEWLIDSNTVDAEPMQKEVRDAFGNLLQDGDSVTVVKELKVKGASPLKAGTKVKDIRLVEPQDGHDIDCKIKGYGAMMLKSSVVKKCN